MDAAAGVFAEVGFEAATSEGIAKRACTSVGSIYQFFSNKQELLLAVAGRCFERVTELFDRLHAEEALQKSWTQFVDDVVDGFFDLQKNDPGFSALYRSPRIHDLYQQTRSGQYRVFIQRSEHVIAHYGPHLTSQRRTEIARMINQVISGGLVVHAYRGADYPAQTIQETKTLLRRYLEPELG